MAEQRLDKWTTNKINSELSNYVIALSLPIFTEDKLGKFKKLFMDRVISKVDPDLKDEDIEIPLAEVDGVKKSQGFAIIHCKTGLDGVRNLIYRGDNARFDKTTRVRFVDKDTFEAILNGKNAPKEPEGTPDSKGQHSQWFAAGENTLFDQIVYVNNLKIPRAVWFNYTTATLETIDLPGHIRNIEKFQFTPDGSFLVAKEEKTDRIRIFFGENWIPFNYIDFWKLSEFEISPCGRVILCKAQLPIKQDNPHKPLGAALFNIHYGTKILSLPLDEKDFDNMTFGAGSVLLHLTLENEKGGTLVSYSGKEYENVKEISNNILTFSPSMVSKIVATFRKQSGAAPPRITFFDTESGEQIHMMPRHNAVAADAYWHPTKAMCAFVIESTDKKGSVFSLSLFDLTDKKSIKSYNITDFKGEIISCAWEPTSNYIAVLVKSKDSSRATHIMVYDITGSTVDKCLNTFLTSGTTIQWSPNGRFAVTDDIDEEDHGSTIQFFDLYEKGLIKAYTVDGLSELEWDQSGMFVMATGSSDFQIFMLDGVVILKNQVGNLRRAVWRPRMMIKHPADPTDEQLLAENEKFCQFGTVDAKSREEDLKQQKLKNVSKWMKFFRPSQPSFGSDSKKNLFVCSILLQGDQVVDVE